METSHQCKASIKEVQYGFFILKDLEYEAMYLVTYV
jgi:hypothetical protein